MQAIFPLVIIAVMSYLIYFIGDYFAKASSNLGDYFNLPKSVKGATFDAVASSMPELMVALFAVISFGKFEVGIGTIAGSAFFNILIIPAICVLVSPIAFKVGKDVINRDAKFYILAAAVLLVATIVAKQWGFLIAGIFIAGYLAYLFSIAKHTKEHRKKSSKKEIKFSIKKEVAIFFGSMIAMGGATYLLTEQSIHLAEIWSISPIIIAFTVIAAATSIPDAVVSIANAKKGDIHDATSNAFGSNIFDIFIGLGIPLLIATIVSGPTTIVFENIEILVALLVTAIGIFFMFRTNDKLNKREAIIMLIVYALFFGYVVYLSFI